MGVTIDRLLRANRTVLLVPMIDGPTQPLLVGTDGSTTPFATPTSAVINSWVSVVSTATQGSSWGGNISCALLDDLNLGLAASDTDSELVICSVGNETTPTFYNVDAEFNVLRDKNKSDTGIFNLATLLLCSADTRYAVVDRIGKSSTSAIVDGDTISIFEVRTDNPVDVKADRANLKLAQTPIPTGVVNVNYTLTGGGGSTVGIFDTSTFDSTAVYA